MESSRTRDELEFGEGIRKLRQCYIKVICLVEAGKCLLVVSKRVKSVYQYFSLRYGHVLRRQCLRLLVTVRAPIKGYGVIVSCPSIMRFAPASTTELG